MGNAPQEGIEMTVGAFMFVLAISFAFLLFRNYGHFNQTVKEEIYDNGIFYEEEINEDTSDSHVTYEEVMGVLMGDSLDYDISINDVIIEKANYNFMQNDITSIPNTNYERTYLRNDSGDIIRVVYKSI